MNCALKWKLIAGLILVFLAGGTLGVFFGASQTFHFLTGPQHSGLLKERMRARFRAQLQLTDEQMAKVSPIIDRTAAELEEVRGSTGRRVREIFAEAHREIAANLTPEQQQKLKDMEARRRRWLHRAHWPHRQTPPAEASPTTSPG
jgi:Spy/CpxP family protein refolding chaperone